MIPGVFNGNEPCSHCSLNCLNDILCNLFNPFKMTVYPVIHAVPGFCWVDSNVLTNGVEGSVDRYGLWIINLSMNNNKCMHNIFPLMLLYSKGLH